MMLHVLKDMKVVYVTSDKSTSLKETFENYLLFEFAILIYLNRIKLTFSTSLKINIDLFILSI